MAGAGDDFVFGDAVDFAPAVTGPESGPGFNDTIIGGQGGDLIYGGQGQDVFIFNRGDGVDMIADFNPLADLLVIDDNKIDITSQAPDGITFADDGFGSQLVSYNGGLDSVQLVGIKPPAPRTSGSEGDDVIVATSQSEIVLGLGGNDRLFAEGGDDTVDGGFRNDLIHAGEGLDVVYGGAGNDTVQGEGGSDKIYTGSGNDKIYGQGGNDRIFSGTGKDAIYGGVGNDTFGWTSAEDAGNGINRDVVFDFGNGTDVIDLSKIDAIAGGADDAFAFVGDDRFTGAAGELRFSVKDAQVQGDLNGDRVIDFIIELRGVSMVTVGDFIL